ncbi:MAG: tRNA (5-methylaminomethyl-2-thiouridylate)-methyltransferase, partial [Gammaproteobacteria bacterium]
LCLVDGVPSDQDLNLAAAVTARYGQGRNAERVDLTVRFRDGSEQSITVKPLTPEEIPQEWFV